jgi:hypothetical protein
MQHRLQQIDVHAARDQSQIASAGHRKTRSAGQQPERTRDNTTRLDITVKQLTAPGKQRSMTNPGASEMERAD